MKRSSPLLDGSMASSIAEENVIGAIGCLRSNLEDKRRLNGFRTTRRLYLVRTVA
jgi:hypothetical protein